MTMPSKFHNNFFRLLPLFTLMPITYKITNSKNDLIYRSGFAVNFPLPVHVCIHQVEGGFWHADEFLTGCYIGRTALDKTNVLDFFLWDLYQYLQNAVASGVYAKSVQSQIVAFGKI